VRIVAGAAKGRRLAGPANVTRPTSDRAREGLFNTLATLVDLDGARVLDLFAGTGAVGLEALSRGAAAAVFVESDRGAAEVLRRNVRDVGLDGARVVRRPVAAVLAEPPPDGPFDLVFADPPYALAEEKVAEMLATLVDNGWLTEHAVVIVERAVRGPEFRWPEGFEPLRERRYGEGVLWYGRRR
jgi:16S rRNA (guanine966-N2)-methyltransferase